MVRYVTPSTFDEALNDILPEGWESENQMLRCPHGHKIELDGTCPEGCTSPLRESGLI